jgi:hypothetical protein
VNDSFLIADPFWVGPCNLPGQDGRAIYQVFGNFN